MNKRNVLLSSLFSFLLIACGGNNGVSNKAIKNLNEKGLNYTKKTFFDAALSSLNGNSNLMKKESAMHLLGIDNMMTSRQIASEYHDNEIAADLKFKGKKIYISGNVNAISKDADDVPYLALAAKNIFMPTQAYFTSKNTGELATYKRRQRAELVCTANGMRVGSVVLKDCERFSAYTHARQNGIYRIAEDFLRVGKKSTDDVDYSIAFIYKLSEFLPKDSSCFKDDRKKCTAEIKKIKNDDMQKIIEQTYQVLAVMNEKK